MVYGTPSVSVLMPAYNAASFVRETIESVRAQTYPHFEFIIRDDCSTDGTWEIIQEFASRDGRIRAARNPENLGISKTRNALVRDARGSYIAWQDADDISLPHRLETQVVFMEANPDIGISGGSLIFFNEKGILSTRTYAEDDATLRRAIFRQSPVAQPAAMVRRAVLERIGNFDETLPQAEDLDVSLRIGTRALFGNVPVPLIMYRLHSSSITTSKLAENIRATLIVRRKAAREYGYPMSFIDLLVYGITRAFVWMPPQATYWIFNRLRNA